MSSFGKEAAQELLDWIGEGEGASQKSTHFKQSPTYFKVKFPYQESAELVSMTTLYPLNT